MKHILFLMAIAIAGCGNRSAKELQFKSDQTVQAVASMETEAEPSEQTSVAVTERKLIRNGDLSFETSDVKKTKKAVEGICKELNAYISNESQNNYGDRLQYSQTIRVPSGQFDALIQKLEAAAVKVESKNISTQDVTEEFIDVEARLKTKKELENRYREILKQAKTVTDIVSIESQIANVRSEIESMEGRLAYLKNQVSFSTLNVSYYEIIGTDFGFATKFIRALAQGWDNLLSFLIVMVNLWPFLLLIGGITWIVTRFRARKKRQ